MEIKNIYPVPERNSLVYKNIRNIVKISFFIIGITCLIINIILKGKAWSLIVVWSLLSIWRSLFSLKLVEFSIFSHAIRIIIHIVILLLIIDLTVFNGLAQVSLPIVLVLSLLIMLILFYIFYNRKDRHIFSIFLLGLLNLAALHYSLDLYKQHHYIILGFNILGIILFIILFITNYKDIKYEIKARILNK